MRGPASSAVDDDNTAQAGARNRANVLALIEALARENAANYQTYNYKLKNTPTGKAILALKPGEARLFVLEALRWLAPYTGRFYINRGPDCVRRGVLETLRRRLPFREDDLLAVLDWHIAQPNKPERALASLVKPLEEYLSEQPPSEALRQRVTTLAGLAGANYPTADDLRLQARLSELIPTHEAALPLQGGEPWAEAAQREVRASPEPQLSGWLAVFRLCGQASGSAPSARWQSAAAQAVEDLGFEVFKAGLLGWFPLVDQPRTAAPPGGRAVDPYFISPANADVLRGLVWMCARFDDLALARALAALAVSAYRKLPGVGPRSTRLGNACVWALGQMPGQDALGPLAVLKLRVKFLPAQKAIDAALETAAFRLGLPLEELEELTVPTYGLEEVGRRIETFGDATAELTISAGKVALGWRLASGKRPASAPKAVKDQYGEALKALTQAKKDIEKMLPAQSARIENLFLEEKRWKLPTWRERYLDHPLVGTLARRLIWKFTQGDRAASGIWWDGQIVDRGGRPLDWLDAQTTVELWHPISAATETVLAWRAWLEQREVRQPFKQAHREVYLLTDAERETRFYSNRFAAHIVKQHQFHALCGQRGWKNRLRLMVDDVVPPPTRLLTASGLRAEFWVDSIGEHYAVDTTGMGSYLYLATDQVRFYPISAPENATHAMGGGYVSWRGERPNPVALEDVPALVFSEIMRDVDLFTGVASVGNDPAWLDGGRSQRETDYWSGFSFGALSETAQTRKQALEKLIPRLKIAPRCSFIERFLVVRGDLRTYKIHLGSGNILMEPNDQYLCIVPARGGAAGASTEKLFLPFEGDNTLAVILSKAFLLAEDAKISDSVIVKQIHGRVG
jgi:hypothetical protein